MTSNLQTKFTQFVNDWSICVYRRWKAYNVLESQNYRTPKSSFVGNGKHTTIIKKMIYIKINKTINLKLGQDSYDENSLAE